MTIEASYVDARKHLESLLDRATQDRETIILTGPNGARVALIAADELESYQGTAHLLRSPANARQALDTLRESLADEDISELRARPEGTVGPTEPA
ncbi:MAG TPA: type II toxin-antitoxin system Phd/YefM family antitoxin [Dehalococcoidia bacterium]|nr:type II toxin-antitoxin system Phd/YefM family antitoxin [Dehalococcoidia bacterium]